MPSGFDFTKKVITDWSSVYANEIYLRRVYVALKEGYVPKFDAVPFLVDDARSIVGMHTFFYDDDFSKQAFQEKVALMLMDNAGPSFDESYNHEWNRIFGDTAYRNDYHNDDRFVSGDSFVAASAFGSYLSDVCADMSPRDRNAVRYAGALSYMVHPADPNMFTTKDKVRSASGKTMTEILEQTVHDFDSYRRDDENKAYAFVRFLSHDDVEIPEAVTALLNNMSAASDVVKAVEKTPVAVTASSNRSSGKPYRRPFNGGSGHALEDWSPNKGDNGFDFDETEYDEELQ